MVCREIEVETNYDGGCAHNTEIWCIEIQLDRYFVESTFMPLT